MACRPRLNGTAANAGANVTVPMSQVHGTMGVAGLLSHMYHHGSYFSY